ncbi:MAG: hypothetical protein J0I07_10570 [Myxococcales bacterium]|nr:hypothetical protein [Myxococcales bacterium]
MKQYLDLVQSILDTGAWQENRTGIRTLSMPGASLRFVFRDGEPDAEGRITECEPPRVLAYTMGAETLRWELAPIPEGTLLVFTTEVKVASAPANDNAIAMCRMAA